MKKILLTIGLLLLPLGALASVWEYGSYQERAQMAAECGIFGYQGTYEQNTSPEVLECFKRLSGKSNELGFSVATRYRTNLSSSVTSNASTIPVSSMTSFDGTALTMGLFGSRVFLSIEPGSAREEIVMCTGISGSTWTGCTRGLAFTGTSTASVSANQKSHNAGSVVVMSNVHYVYDELVDKDSGDVLSNYIYYNASTSDGLILANKYSLVSKDYVDTRSGYYEAPVANFAALPTGVNQGEMRVTLDDGKVYTWSGSTWILAGAGGGAGTVYRDDITVTSSAQLIYSLSSGSWPDKKYLQVFLNGQLLSEGDSADYQASTTGNSITLNFAPVVGEVITLRVESIDFYNANWNSVNEDLLPDTDNTHDIGSSSLKFKDLYLAGNASVGGTLEVTGTTTLATTTATILSVGGTSTSGLLNGSVIGGYHYHLSTTTIFSTSTLGVATHTNTITHNLGYIPKYIEGSISFINSNGDASIINGFYSSTTNTYSSNYWGSSSSGADVVGSNSSSFYGNCSPSGVNTTLTFTFTNLTTSTASIQMVVGGTGGSITSLVSSFKFE